MIAEVRTFGEKGFEIIVRGTSMNRATKHLGRELPLVYTILTQWPASLGLLYAGVIITTVSEKQ